MRIKTYNILFTIKKQKYFVQSQKNISLRNSCLELDISNLLLF